MSCKPSYWIKAVAAVAVLTVSMSSFAQEAAESDETKRDAQGTLFAEASLWIAKPNGLSFDSASRVNPSSFFESTPLSPTYGTEADARWRVGYSFGKAGRIVGTWFAQRAVYEQFEVSPGIFQFGELLVDPLFAGYQNDGLADSFAAESSASTRDLRLDFYRNLVDGPKVRADWFVGLRRVQHNRDQRAAYDAVVPDLPALGPPLCAPCPTVFTIPDTVRKNSKFTGRGVNAGLDAEFSFWDGRFSLESGFSIAALIADVDTQYFSRTSFYDYVTPAGDLVILSAQNYDEAFGGTRDDGMGGQLPNFEFITLVEFPVGYSEVNSSTGTFVVDGYIGLRSNVWRQLEVFFGYRTAHYSDVSREAVPEVNVGLVGLNGQTIRSQRHSLTLDGIYTGIAYRF